MSTMSNTEDFCANLRRIINANGGKPPDWLLKEMGSVELEVARRNAAEAHVANGAKPVTETKHMVCSSCGSHHVRCDAYAAWNYETQEWELVQTYDKGAYCEDCDGETRIEEREGPPPSDDEDDAENA